MHSIIILIATAIHPQNPTSQFVPMYSSYSYELNGNVKTLLLVFATWSALHTMFINKVLQGYGNMVLSLSRTHDGVAIIVSDANRADSIRRMTLFYIDLSDVYKICTDEDHYIVAFTSIFINISLIFIVLVGPLETIVFLTSSQIVMQYNN